MREYPEGTTWRILREYEGVPTGWHNDSCGKPWTVRADAVRSVRELRHMYPAERFHLIMAPPPRPTAAEREEAKYHALRRGGDEAIAVAFAPATPAVEPERWGLWNVDLGIWTAPHGEDVLEPDPDDPDELTPVFATREQAEEARRERSPEGYKVRRLPPRRTP